MGFYLLALGTFGDLRLTGLDGDLVRLARARRERVPARLFNGLLPRLPFRDASFDKVLASEVIEHVPDDRAALGEIARVMKPGGTLALSVPHADYPFWWDPINKVWTALGGAPIRRGPLVGIWTGHERLYRPAELTKLVESAGFAVEACEEATHHAFPFSHFLLYGIGKPLLEKGLLPRGVAAGADRFMSDATSATPPLAIRLVRSLFGVVDARNESPAAREKRTFVNVVLRARKR